MTRKIVFTKKKEAWFNCDLTWQETRSASSKNTETLGKLSGWCWIHLFIFSIFCQMLNSKAWSRNTKYILLKHREKTDAFFHRKAQHINKHHPWPARSQGCIPDFPLASSNPVSLSPQPSCYCVDELTVTRWSDLLKIQSPEWEPRCSFAQGYTSNEWKVISFIPWFPASSYTQLPRPLLSGPCTQWECLTAVPCIWIQFLLCHLVECCLS